MSQMPCTPWRSRSSHTLKASTMLVPRSRTAIRRSFGITMTVSAASWRRVEALVGRPRAACALEAEGPRHDGDRQGAHLAGDLRDERRAARAGAAALAGGDEHEVAAAQGAAHVVLALAHGGLAEVRVAAGAEAAGDLHPDRDADVRLALLERLAVGVDGDELDAAQAGLDHAVDRVAARAADADDADHRDVVGALAGATGVVLGLVAAARRLGARLGAAEELGERALPHARARAAGAHAAATRDAPGSTTPMGLAATSRASWRYQRAAWPDGSYRITLLPSTGASAKRIVLPIRVR